MGLGVSKVDEHAIAEVLGDEPVAKRLTTSTTHAQ
jgi:hypothetical protein